VIERFAGAALDPAIWVPYYLPHWSSRASSVPTYVVADGELRLSIPPSQGLWAEGIHETPLRVSRAVVSPRSMVAFWMSGIEDTPERSGEICVMEVFGDAGPRDLGVVVAFMVGIRLL
jgi:hypothetical protein